MSLSKIISIVFFIIAIVLAGYLAYSIKFKIDEDKRIARQEKQVIDKLKMVRDGEIAYQTVMGNYTGSWDTLVNFLDTGTMYITQRSEQIISLNYGVDSVVVTIDTIGHISVKDSMFVIKEPVPSLLSGEIESIDVSEGQTVKKGDVLYSVMNEKGKSLKMRAPVDATIKLINNKPGDKVETEEGVVVVAYPRIENVKNLPYLPNNKENKKFDLFAGKIVRGNVVVSVFEAKDTDPVNPIRKKKEGPGPLKVGSRTDVSISGNWE